MTKLTVPETVAPFAGELIVTEPAGAGVGAGVCGLAACVGVGVEVTIAVRVAVRVGAGLRFAAIEVPRLATTVKSVTVTMRR